MRWQHSFRLLDRRRRRFRLLVICGGLDFPLSELLWSRSLNGPQNNCQNLVRGVGISPGAKTFSRI